MPVATLPPEVKHRSFPFEVKATGVSTEDGQEFGEIEAYGSVFSVIDEGDDEVKPGAFKRTIQASKQRIQSGKANFLAAMLWQHDPSTPIGGWYDLKEDDHGLRCKGRIVLATTKGRECYELIKAGVIDQFSIGYDIPKNGANYNPKSGTRELTEVRLWEVSPVTFAMCPDALLIGVKSMEQKSVCGNTSLPIGPRDESWDGSKAKKQIFAYAEKEDGSIDSAKAKKCFLQVDGDPSLKGSYGYPFCYVESGSPRISVGGVKACAGALSGSRGADTSGGDVAGMRRKVATMYRKINKKYPNDTELTPPWEDNGKAGGRYMETKTFDEHYAEEMCEDLLEDWQDRLICAFTYAVLDACKIGDTIETDVQDALAGFGKQVMVWVAQAQQYNLSDYLEEHAYTYSSADNLMQNGSSSSNGYDYMSSDRHKLRLKAGRAISAATQAIVDDSEDGKKFLQTKSAIAQTMQDQADKLREHADKAMQEHTKSVNAAATDFANNLQGAETPAYEDGDGVADEDQQEGRGKSQSSPYTRTPAPQQRPSKKDTALEDVEIPASWIEDIKLRKMI